MKELRPMTIGPIFDQILKVVFNKDSMKLLGIYAALIVGPVIFFVLQAGALYQRWFNSNLIGSGILTPQAAVEGNYLLEILASIFLFVFSAFITIMYTLMSTDLFGKRFLQTPYKIIPSFRLQLKRVPGFLLFLLIIAIYYGLLIFVFSIFAGAASMLSLGAFGVLLGILIVIAAILFFIVIANCSGVFIRGVIPAMAVDRCGLFRSIGRSFKLMVKNFFRILGISLLFHLLIFIGSYILVQIITVIFGLLAIVLNRDAGVFSSLLLPIAVVNYSLLMIINLLFVNAFNVIIYFNQKIRHEGFGAELLAQEFLAENVKAGGEASPL
jgi:hypothetical protein